jgi:hypothetical protein
MVLAPNGPFDDAEPQSIAKLLAVRISTLKLRVLSLIIGAREADNLVRLKNYTPKKIFEIRPPIDARLDAFERI